MCAPVIPFATRNRSVTIEIVELGIWQRNCIKKGQIGSVQETHGSAVEGCFRCLAQWSNSRKDVRSRKQEAV